MPSWNIHTGLVEHVLAPGDAATLGIRDANLFLFGNLVPDIYVGYMAPDVSHTLRYIDTHYGQPTHIPVPEVGRFWDDWVAPAIPQGGVDDVVLGAWAHLLADNRYNACVRTFNEARSIPSGERTRIAKQGDFDLFGHSLGISSTVEVTPALVAAAARFPQYAVEAADVARAAAAARAIVEAARRPPERTTYELLPRDLIQEVFDSVVAETRAGLAAYTAALREAGFDPSAPAPELPLHRPDLWVGPEPAIRFAGDPQAGAAVNDPVEGAGAHAR